MGLGEKRRLRKSWFSRRGWGKNKAEKELVQREKKRRFISEAGGERDGLEEGKEGEGIVWILKHVILSFYCLITYCHNIVILLYFHIVILSYCYIVILLYFHIVILSYCYIVILLYCYIVILSYCYIFILLYWHNIAYWLIVIMSYYCILTYCHIVILLYSHIGISS